MDRSKIEKAAKLNTDLTALEHRIKMLEEDGEVSYFYDLAMILSPTGYVAARAAVLFEARTDRAALEKEIMEL